MDQSDTYKALNLIKITWLEMGNHKSIGEGFTLDGRYFRLYPRQPALDALRMLDDNPALFQFMETLNRVKREIYKFKQDVAQRGF